MGRESRRDRCRQRPKPREVGTGGDQDGENRGGREDGERGEMLPNKENRRTRERNNRGRGRERRRGGQRAAARRCKVRSRRPGAPQGRPVFSSPPPPRPCLCSDEGGRPWPQTVHAAPFRPQL